MSVDELVRGIGMSLGRIEVFACPAFDRDGDGLVLVDEIVLASNNAMGGCNER